MLKKGDKVSVFWSNGYDHIFREGEIVTVFEDESEGILTGSYNNLVTVITDKGKKAVAHATRFKKVQKD